MNNQYFNTSHDYLIQNEAGKFYAMRKDYDEKEKIRTRFTDNPNKACVLFKEDAEGLIEAFNNDSNMPEFKNCQIVKRDEIIEEYNKKLIEV